MSPPDSWLPRKGGTLRLLNKIDATVETLHLVVGQPATYAALRLTLQACFVRPPDLPADATAHLTITDQSQAAPDFDGWVLAKEPGLNMLEHPVYDAQLVGCDA